MHLMNSIHQVCAFGHSAIVESSGVSETSNGLNYIDMTIIVIYLVGMLCMGFFLSLNQKTTTDFFLGGRTLPSWAVGISLFASMLSTISYLSVPGEMFRSSSGFLLRYLSLPFVLVVVCLLWIPFFSSLKFTSAYEYLEKRFSYPVRLMGAFLCILMLIGWMSVVVLTASKALAEIAQLNLSWFFGENGTLHNGLPYNDADMHFIIISIGFFSIIYTTMGGIKAVVWTDVIQFFVLISGAIFTVGFIAWNTGSSPVDWYAATKNYPHGEQVEWYSTDISNRSTVLFLFISAFFWSICSYGSNQVAVQRYFSVKNRWEAQKSFIISSIVSIAFGLFLCCVGIALVYFVQNQSEISEFPGVFSDVIAERHPAQGAVFPAFIREYLPTGLRGLVVAALFAASMSSIDSGANSVSTIFTIDLYRRWFKKTIDPKAELRTARILTATMGVVIVGSSLALYHFSHGTNIIDLMQKGFNWMLGPLGALFVLGLFFPFVSSRAVFIAVILGEIVGLATSYFTELTRWISINYPGNPFFEEPMYFSTHLVIGVSWATTIICGILLGLICGKVPEEKRQWTWKNITTGKIDAL